MRIRHQSTSIRHRVLRPRSAVSLTLIVALGVGCTGDDSGDDRDATSIEAPEATVDIRQIYRSDEIEGVVAMVADCFVVEDGDGAARYSTTVEVDNTSGNLHAVAVVIDADEGRGGTSDTFEVPAGGKDAWAVVGEDTTTTPVGDVECTDFINAISVIVDE